MIRRVGMRVVRRLPYLSFAVLLAVACGRTELDTPEDDAGPLAGAGGSADEGTAGSGGGEGGATGGSIAGRGGSVGGSVAGRGGTGGTGGGMAGRGGMGGSLAGRGGMGGNPAGVAGRGGAGGIAGRGGMGGGIAGRGGMGGNPAGVGGRGGAGGNAMGRAGAMGRGGSGGTAGAGGTAPIPIPCGQTTCTPGVQACCIQQQNQAMCIDAQSTCPGPSVGCLNGAACTAGDVCCLSLVGRATSCVTASTCNFAGGFILCSSSAECPDSARNCCRLGQIGVCRAQRCN
jgi:hypothetical protein